MNQLKVIFNPIVGKFDYISEFNGAFQRILQKNLTLKNGECIVVSRYIRLNGKKLVLKGDSVVHIL